MKAAITANPMTYTITLNPLGLSGTQVILALADPAGGLAAIQSVHTVADGDPELVADAVLEAARTIVKEIL